MFRTGRVAVESGLTGYPLLQPLKQWITSLFASGPTVELPQSTKYLSRQVVIHRCKGVYSVNSLTRETILVRIRFDRGPFANENVTSPDSVPDIDNRDQHCRVLLRRCSPAFLLLTCHIALIHNEKQLS